METVETIDVTIIEPRLKHPTIFEKFDNIGGGQAFIIHNDHDPKPLYYQLIGERGPIFNWEYLEQGPEYWKVKISKLNIGEKPETVAEIVAKDYRKAEVFKKLGIDFCCGGKKTLEKACREKGLDLLRVRKELEFSNSKANMAPSQDYNRWELDFLADFILNTHHRYVIQTIPRIFEFTQKIARVHGDRHPELHEVANIFLSISDELNRHMCKEEQVLFPYIKNLAETSRNNMQLDPPHFGTIQNPIRMMEAEHEEVGELSFKLREITSDFTPPADACTSYRITFSILKEFEDDLFQHIHLENNILFPKAIELEKALLEK